MRHLSLLLLFPLLTGCVTVKIDQTPENSSSSSVAAMGNVLTIQLEKSTTESSDAIPTTKAILKLSGAVDRTIVIPDITGELMNVKPGGFVAYEQESGETVAIVTAWFAGGGDEIVITRMHDTHTLIIEHRQGDEEGTCPPGVSLANIALAEDVTVSLQGFGEPTAEQSSLEFCHE